MRKHLYLIPPKYMKQYAERLALMYYMTSYTVSQLCFFFKGTFSFEGNFVCYQPGEKPLTFKGFFFPMSLLVWWHLIAQNIANYL